MSAARWTVRALLLMVVGLLGCEPSGGSNACERDSDCERGLICEGQACTELPCEALNSCPGSGRTCLFDLRACSPNECASTINGVEQFCDADQVCVEGGPFRGTCLSSDGLSCTVDAECAPLGPTFQCCGGTCGAECVPSEDAGIPVGDMSVADAGDEADGGGDSDGGVSPDGGQGPDAGEPGGGLCAPCGRNDDCAALGDDAECTAIGNTGSFCTSACAAPDDCPAGFQCLAAVGQCVPANFNCEICPAVPCGGGLVCDVATGMCVPPRQTCESCSGDESCAPGLRCSNAGGSPVCLAECPGGMCPAGYTCDGALCQPDGGACDACNGACAPPTPVCLQAEGRCVECDAATPCADPEQVCSPNNTCEDQGGGCECVADNDCDVCLGAPICFRGRCVQCLEDAECPPRFACNENQQCVAAPCRGVACQAGAMCDPRRGLCVNENGDPACTTPMDCALPDAMGCNVDTGQCYYTGGRCDPPGGDGVCAPGSNCNVNMLIPELSGCSCKIDNPLGMPPGPEIVSCQPGGLCIHGESLPGSMMAAEEGFCLHLGF